MEENIRMNGLGNANATNPNEEETSFNFKTIVAMLILNWQWIVLSAIICLCSALIYLRYKSPIYQVSVKMLIKGGKKLLMNFLYVI